jgi:hypothetical protein
MWSTSRITGTTVALLTSEQRPKSSLWTYGLDVRWPFGWGPVIVGAIVTSSGCWLLPEALRSENAGPSSEALIKLSLVGRWRSAFWIDAPSADA